MDNGWIKLHRRFSDWEWYNISEMVHLFIHLLVNANHKTAKWRGIEIQRGQIVTGLLALNSATGISIQKIRTCLKRLESTSEITLKSTNKYTIITICKYDSYQNENTTTNKQLTNNQQTNNKQITTNKNDKNNKNEKNEREYTEIFDDYKKHLLSRTTLDRLSMNAPVSISQQHSEMVMNEFLQTCYGDLVEKKTKLQAEQYFINWVKKDNRVNEAINNQIRKRNARNKQNTTTSN
jgi:hypothetical protein